MGLKAVKGGGFVREMQAKLRDFPKTVAAEVAVKAAPALTDLAQGSFDGGQNVYGDARPAGVDGRKLTLRKTGTAEGVIRFVAVGTQVRTPVFPRYMRYLIGKYGVLPNGKAAIPTAWKARLAEIVSGIKGPV